MCGALTCLIVGRRMIAAATKPSIPGEFQCKAIAYFHSGSMAHLHHIKGSRLP